jgi:hypothetical protein
MSTRTPVSAALVDLATGRFGRHLDRRSMLRRSTLAATALVAAPAEFVLRPKSAYAAVCRCRQGCPCGSLCCDAYTEFCCTITGSNGCPPGTVAAGWWKVDGSRFCGGAPRYYLDCNAQCGRCRCRGGVCDGSCSKTPCGCAAGNCNNRQSGCVKFRYGQCNQHLGCVGPIVCRVATCTPPWILDGSCTTASRTDNHTANHTRPCLEAPFGALDGLVDLGGAIGVTGWAIDQNRRDGVDAQVFVDEQPVHTVPADRPRPDVGAAYPYYGADHGFDVSIDAPPGRHVVCLYGRDRGSGVSKFLGFAAIELSGPVGHVDRIAARPSAISVTGWLVDPLDPATPATVALVIDGQEVARMQTSASRPDVVAGYPEANATSGYAFDFPVAAGAHEVCVQLVYRSGRITSHQCTTVQVP